MAGALSGFRIIDLSWGIAGPIGTWMLAEQGADVVKVEPPGGDPFRSLPGYAVWNRSKRSVVLDLETDEGRRALRALLGTADVLVESFTPGTMERWGLDYASLAEELPRLVYLSLPGYPSDSSRAQRPGYDALVAAWSGEAYSQEGVGRREGPAFLYMPMPSMASSFLVTTAINVALRAREKTGRGQRVETSLLQGVMLFTSQIWQTHERSSPRGLGRIAKSGNASLFECSDGEWIHVHPSAKGSLNRLYAIIGLPDPGDTSRMPRTAEATAQRIAREAEAVRLVPRDELLRKCWENDVPAQPVQMMSDLYADPQFIANGMVQQVRDPELGETTQVGIPFTLDVAPGAIKGGQPRIGAHNEEVLGAVHS